uniref:WD repeat-containing protein 43 n=1 Tax=Anthurium amnicola TaxID=1678845 RepID=A0A1D1YHV6_9ARAE
MAFPNIRDLLTAFSPYAEFFAISTGDGRIKIWDTLKGQLQTEFTSITSPDATASLQPRLGERGHLSLDYKCMQWVQLGNKKKKKKSGNFLLVLGTGGGDVLALDVSAGQLKWKVSDCHPGGVSSVSFSNNGSLYTGGVDGMVCQIDASSGNLLGKFRASTKAISSLSLSPDGRILATAASQLKIFTCSDNKKIQKFSGHPVGVRCMIFSEDGKYILTSGIGERFVAFWKIDGRKKQSTTCVLSMEHPAVFLGCKVIDVDSSEDAGFYVLAISEIGLCYFWYGKSIEELRNSKPTKISVSIEHSLSKKHNDLSSALYSAKFQGVATPASATVLFAYGSIVKPSFEKLSLQAGMDIRLNCPRDGILLPMGQSNSQKVQGVQTDATMLDRANAEDAIMPIPKLYISQNKKRKHIKSHAPEVLGPAMLELEADVQNEAIHEVYMEKAEEDDAGLCLEDRLKSAGILDDEDHISLGKPRILPKLALDTSVLKEPHTLVGMNLPAKKIKSTILCMAPGDALKFLEVLMLMWKKRSISERSILPWISGILVNHGRFIASHESSIHMLATLHKMTMFKSLAAQNLLQLSGRFQLFMAQASHSLNREPMADEVDESEIEDDDMDEVIYGEEEDASESGADSDEMDNQF